LGRHIQGYPLRIDDMQQLGKNLNIIIHSCHIKIATLVARCLKPFLKKRFGKIAIRHLFNFFDYHNFILRHGEAVSKIGNAKDERKDKT
jgi:hypothetical protein